MAARSYPRRFRALLVRPDDDDPAVVHRRPAPGEASALELAAAAAGAMVAAARALDAIAVRDDPEVSLATTPPAGGGTGGDPTPLEEVLRLVEQAGVELAAAIAHTRANAWGRPAHDASGVALTAMDVAREGVHGGIHHLRAVERALNRAR